MKDDSRIQLLAGSMELEAAPMEPFSDEVIAFLAALSGRIRRLPRPEAGEELRALGFWLRQAHLTDLKEQYNRTRSLGLGIAFHIAPSNVPLMFLYSCAIGLLAGNSCRVRVSGRRTEECERVCGLIEELLSETPYTDMKKRICILSYDRSFSDLTERFSRECDARIIWGGDRTVEEIRKIPLRSSACEVAFPDRTSIAVLDAGAVLALDEDACKNLANRFYNDTYAMDQNACSCPRIVFWAESDEETGHRASERFWKAVAASAERYALSEIKVSRKYGALWEYAGTDAKIRHIRRFKNRLYVLEASDLAEGIAERPMQFGSFLEYHMKDKNDWIRAVTEKMQTLTYFGLCEEDLRTEVCRRRLRGVHRIVPIGQALFMDLTWDGKDLIQSLSRTIG
ncbi:MAG: hypothetical protein LUE86_01155 [Clostridiales bacterium]|nr:hypothetical protein [Clostridiales bacterium]